jgi:hypothetical protein
MYEGTLIFSMKSVNTEGLYSRYFYQPVIRLPGIYTANEVKNETVMS